MPQKPDPRKTFDAYLGVQADYNTRLTTVLLRASSDAEKDILKITGKGIGAIVQREQLTAVNKAIHERLASIYRTQGNLIEAGRQEAAGAAIKSFQVYEKMLLQSAVPKASLDAYLASAQVTSKAGIEAVMQRIMGKSYHPLAYSVYNTGKLSTGLVDRYVESALARGLNARQIAAGVRDMINPNVKGGVSYAAQRLGRTEINNAFHSVSTDKYEKSPYVTGVDWNLSGSHPENDECDDLANGGPYPKDAVPEKPHVLCFCFITPEMMSENDFLDGFFSGKFDNGPAPLKPEGITPASLLKAFEGGHEPIMTVGKSVNPVSLVRLSDGSKGILKYLYDPKIGLSEMNRELLSKHVLDALGVRAPAAVEVLTERGGTHLLSEYIEGQTLWESLNANQRMWAKSGEYKYILKDHPEIVDVMKADFIMKNQDRHLGNIMIGTDGKIWAIDHGDSLNSDKVGPAHYSGGLQAHLMYNQELWGDIPATQAKYRKALTPLKAAFEAVDALDKWQGIMDAIEKIGKLL